MSTLLCFWQKVFVLNKTNMCIKIMKYFLNSTWICLTHRCPEHESIWLTTAKNMTLFDSHLYRTWLCLPHRCPGHESVWLTAALNKTLFDSLLSRTALFRTGLCLTQPCPEQRCSEQRCSEQDSVWLTTVQEQRCSEHTSTVFNAVQESASPYLHIHKWNRVLRLCKFV